MKSHKVFLFDKLLLMYSVKLTALQSKHIILIISIINYFELICAKRVSLCTLKLYRPSCNTLDSVQQDDTQVKSRVSAADSTIVIQSGSVFIDTCPHCELSREVR